MNSYMILLYSMFFSTWMISLMHYDYYQTLTVQILRKTLQEEYIREGLKAYGQAYYRYYEHSLALPLTISPQCPLESNNTTISLRKEQGMLLVEVYAKAGEKIVD